MKVSLTPPISLEQIHTLNVGDIVSLNGIIVTGRDAAHKYLMDTFIKQDKAKDEDRKILDSIKKYLNQGILYHCGPVMKEENGKYTVIAAGPTTSIREEPYEYDVIKFLGLRGVIGKGGMKNKTLSACKEFGAVYLHAIGGAATLIAQSMVEVIGVEKLDLGVPEAFWIIRVENFECVVTMASNGESLHNDIEASSKEILTSLLQGIK